MQFSSQRAHKASQMTMVINTPKPARRINLVVEQELTIPKHLPPAVRDVAESLALRDPESARRYLEIHQPQYVERRQITH